MPGTRSPNLTLLPELAAGLRERAPELGLDLAVLVAILVRNDAIAPAALAALPAGKMAREKVSCSMRTPILRLADRGARRCGLTRNAYLEALVAELLERDDPFVVLRSKGGAKL